MPELIIKYKNKRTLEALKDFSKYFEFSILPIQKKEKRKDLSINGVTIIPADSSIDTSDLETIFSAKGINAKQLRRNAWKRSR